MRLIDYKNCLKTALKPALIVAGLLATAPSVAQTCRHWSEQIQLAALPHDQFKEVSGIAASKRFPDRIYIVNDSGDGGRFYSYELATGNFQSVQIEGFKGFDIEAISVGPCGNDSCVYIGDIGNNRSRNREIVRVLAIKEQATFAETITPHRHKKFRYPGDPRDAEAMIVDDSGDIYIFSKEFDDSVDWNGVGPTHIFKTSYSKLAGSDTGRLELVGKLQLQHFPLPTNVFTVTDAALSRDQTNIVFMTYLQGVEMSWTELLAQLARKESVVTMSYRGFSTIWGAQSEAITYLHPNDQILWTFEDSHGDPPLLSRTCLN